MTGDDASASAAVSATVAGAEISKVKKFPMLSSPPSKSLAAMGRNIVQSFPSGPPSKESCKSRVVRRQNIRPHSDVRYKRTSNEVHKEFKTNERSDIENHEKNTNISLE